MHNSRQGAAVVDIASMMAKIMFDLLASFGLSFRVIFFIFQ
jgi:hypothetical protein